MTSGDLDIPQVKAGKLGRVLLPEAAPSYRSSRNCWLTVKFRLKDASSWAEAGHEVAWFQHRLDGPISVSIPATLSSSPRLKVQSSKAYYRVHGPNFSLLFDRARGCLTQWTSHGKPLLDLDPVRNSALSLSFWRAPIDNDILHDTRVWKHYGVDVLTSQLRSFTLDSFGSYGEVQLIATSYISPPILN
jgi:beta-galactosidase